MFMINEQANTKLKFGDETEKPAAGTENLVRAAQQKGISSIQKKFDSKQLLIKQIEKDKEVCIELIDTFKEKYEI